MIPSALPLADSTLPPGISERPLRASEKGTNQIRNDTPGRASYERKIAEGKTKKEALRALKRRISDAVYRQLVLDANR